MATIKFFVDPGHGGSDSGAVGPTQLKESTVNLAVALNLGGLLKSAGVTIAYSRTGNTFPSINERCRLSNNFGADYFLSVHCNSNGPTAEGIETLVRTNGSTAFKLAEPIQAALIAATGERSRGIKFRTDLGVLNGTNAPAVLVEIGFISHPATEAKLKTDAYQQKIAWAVFDGIAAFLNLEQPTPVDPPEPPPTSKPVVVITAPETVEIQIARPQGG